MRLPGWGWQLKLARYLIGQLIGYVKAFSGEYDMTGCRRTYEDRSPLVCPVTKNALLSCLLFSVVGILAFMWSVSLTEALAQPLSGQAAKNFSGTLPGLRPEEFGILRLLDKKELKNALAKNDGAVKSLEQDAKKSRWRQPWEDLRDQYLSIAISAPRTDLSAEALFRAASCQRSLAECSHQNKDWRMSISLYEALYSGSPKSRLADDALLACAAISAQKLKNTRQARKYLDLHAKKYAKSDTAKEAQALSATLEKGQGQKDAKQNDAKQQKDAKKEAGDKAETKERAPRICHANGRPYSITIDAGHGGHDPGTVHNGILERDITLDIALRLGRQLQQYGITVYYTRTKNTFVSLPQRSNLANRTGSDLFVSIHVNANPSQAARGLEVYYLDTQATCGVTVADRENGTHKKASPRKAAAKPVSAKQAATASRMVKSQKLAALVKTNLHTAITGKGYTVEKNSVKKAPFFVLAATAMPSILAEVGYCSNKEDAALLKKAAYRQSLSDGLADGILAWMRHNTQSSGYVAENTGRGAKKKAVR